jgi:hypothetical protein
MDLFRIALPDISRHDRLRFAPFPQALQSMSLTKGLADSVDYFLVVKVSCNCLSMMNSLSQGGPYRRVSFGRGSMVR